MNRSVLQLKLPLPPVPAAAVSPFIAAPSNRAALSWLANPELWPRRQLLLVAEAGGGKSHLLAQWSAERDGLLVPGADLPPLPPAATVLAIDDADQAPEEALLHALNAAAERGGLVLMSAKCPAALWPARLPDLVSRLRATASVEIGRPEDSLLRLLLAKLLAERQLAVPEILRDWLVRHLPRSPAAIRAAAARLDAMLAPGSRATHAIAQAVVEDVVASRKGEGS